MLFLDVTNKCTLTTANQKKMDYYDSQSICYEIAKRISNFVMTYVGNCMINMTLVMLFLVGNK